MTENKTVTGNNHKVGFLDDGKGQPSSTRLMSMIALVAAIIFGYMELTSKANPPYITMMFLIAAYAPKALQKFIEDRFGGQK